MWTPEIWYIRKIDSGIILFMEEFLSSTEDTTLKHVILITYEYFLQTSMLRNSCRNTVIFYNAYRHCRLLEHCRVVTNVINYNLVV